MGGPWEKYAASNDGPWSKYGAASAAPPPEEPGMGESFLRGGAQGATLGFADEIAGGAGALADAARKVSLSDLVKDYIANRDKYREADEAAQKANPWSYNVGGLTGGVATAFVPGLGIAEAPTALGRAMASAKLGAVAGLGSSNAELAQGDVKGLARDAAIGGALGGITQPAFEHVIAPAVGYLGEKAGDALGWAGKKAMKAGLDVPEADVTRYLNNPEAVNNADTLGGIGQKLADTLGEVKGTTGELNDTARGFLSTTRKPIKGLEAQSAIDTLRQFDDKSAQELANRLEADLIERKGVEPSIVGRGEWGQPIHDPGRPAVENAHYLTESEAHDVKKTLQNLGNWDSPLPNYDQAKANYASGRLNNLLKNGNGMLYGEGGPNAEASFAQNAERANAAPSGPGGAGAGIGPSPDAGALPRDSTPLEGLPKSSPGPTPQIKQVAREYVKSKGLPDIPQETYTPVDPERGARIAQAFEEMPHNPEDPRVKGAYDALIGETMEQWELMKKLGLKVEIIEPGMPNPYPQGSSQMIEDVRNGHLWVFPTELGFGSGDLGGNPLLGMSGEKIGQHELTYNDIFRAVHDFFGHAKEGVGFGPNGEENAWQSHARMYTPEARAAMTTETRGQNSWVNFGPHGESNQANKAATKYAEQKIGLLPDWAINEGFENATPGYHAGNPEYKDAMAKLSANMQVKNDLARRFGIQRDFSGANPSGYTYGDTTISALKGLGNANKVDRARVLDQLKSQGYGDIAEAVQNSLLKKRLEGGYANGSRRAVMGGATGAATAHFLGIPGGEFVGGSIGALAGGALDKYAGPAAKGILDATLLVQRLAKNPATQKYVGAIQNAASRGQGALAATHFILSQTEPAYQKAVQSE